MAAKRVQVVTVTLPQRKKFEPNYVSVSDEDVKRLNQRKRPPARSRAVPADLLTEDPAFASALAQQIRLITTALARLEHLTSAGQVPDGVLAFRDSLRGAIDAYTTSLEGETAVRGPRAGAKKARGARTDAKRRQR